MKKIIIIGGGFVGLSALKYLLSNKIRPDLDITLIDKTGEFTFLPMLPDVIGRGINPENLVSKTGESTNSRGIRFIKGAVLSLNLKERLVRTVSEAYSYDYLLIASGSETNFYNNDQIRRRAYKLDDARDAEAIRNTLIRKRFDSYLIAGGGYTGIEIATNLRRYLNSGSREGRIVIVERATSILAPLPQWMKDYVGNNLGELGVEVFCNAVVEKTEEDKVYISGGRLFENSMLIWTAGVKTAAFIQDLKVDKNPQSRIKVDGYLRLDDNCFVAGDSAYFLDREAYLRMAVQFAITQGYCAAENIIRSIRGLKLRKYTARDLGYVIPMANNRSCGVILGLNFKGRIPTLMHYMMCIYRLEGFRNKAGIVAGLIKGGGLW